MLYCANRISVAALGNSPVTYGSMAEKTVQDLSAVLSIFLDVSLYVLLSSST